MISIRALQPEDDRSGFHCGDEDLDRFFRKYAGENQFVHHLGATYVAVDGDRVAGFVTVAPGDIRADALPERRARRLPRYPLPILRLARLGVDRSHQGRGLGTGLLRFTFALALEMSEKLGCIGVVVDAKVGAVGFYEKLGFQRLVAVEGQLRGTPELVPMFLSIETIRAAGA